MTVISVELLSVGLSDYISAAVEILTLRQPAGLGLGARPGPCCPAAPVTVPVTHCQCQEPEAATRRACGGRSSSHRGAARDRDR